MALPSRTDIREWVLPVTAVQWLILSRTASLPRLCHLPFYPILLRRTFSPQEEKMDWPTWQRALVAIDEIPIVARALSGHAFHTLQVHRPGSSQFCALDGARRPGLQASGA